MFYKYTWKQDRNVLHPICRPLWWWKPPVVPVGAMNPRVYKSICIFSEFHCVVANLFISVSMWAMVKSVVHEILLA